jgi:peptidoglycan glycosyltransferase
MSVAAQRTAADALAGQRGSVVLLDVRTGGIVAMYSNPSYDPNPLTGHNSKLVNAYFEKLTTDPNKPDLPRAFRERYPPGSTFKVVTATVAIDDGVATPDREFPQLSQLDLPLTTSKLQNFGGETCGGSLFESLVESCNTTFGRVGLEIGPRFPEGMARFGIGESPPLDVAPGAVPSIAPLPDFQTNQPLYAFAGIGQGEVAMTPLQMALIAEAIANGGEIKEPHVGKEIRDANDNLVRRIDPDGKEWKTATNPSTAAALSQMMQGVVERGTGTAAQLPGIKVAGKTGTAQHAGGGSPHAWFIGFAPADNPQYAVAVLVEQGGNSGSEATGGRVAAPIAARMLRVALGI